MPIPPRKKSTLRIQPNRHFETEEEMKQWVEQNHPNAIIKSFWPVHLLACEIEMEKEKK